MTFLGCRLNRYLAAAAGQVVQQQPLVYTLAWHTPPPESESRPSSPGSLLPPLPLCAAAVAGAATAAADDDDDDDDVVYITGIPCVHQRLLLLVGLRDLGLPLPLWPSHPVNGLTRKVGK